jgi:hypothetical protein
MYLSKIMSFSASSAGSKNAHQTFCAITYRVSSRGVQPAGRTGGDADRGIGPGESAAVGNGSAFARCDRGAEEEGTQPTFKPSGMEGQIADDVLAPRGHTLRVQAAGTGPPKRLASDRRRKIHQLTIHQKIPVSSVQPLVAGSRFEGCCDFVVQDLKTESFNARYRLDVWPPPAGHQAAFGADKDQSLITGLHSLFIIMNGSGTQQQVHKGYVTQIGNAWFTGYSSIFSKNRINFLELLYKGVSSLRIQPLHTRLPGRAGSLPPRSAVTPIGRQVTSPTRSAGRTLDALGNPFWAYLVDWIEQHGAITSYPETIREWALDMP